MARLARRRPLSRRRFYAVSLLLIALSGVMACMVSMPLRQVYWGVFARLRPMVSEEDLVRLGKHLPGGLQGGSSAGGGGGGGEARRLLPTKEELDSSVGLTAGSAGDDGGGGGGGSGGAAQQAAEGGGDGNEAAASDGAEAAGAQGQQQPAQQQEQQAQQGSGGDAQSRPRQTSTKLTREMVAAVAESNTVMVTWANYHYRDFVFSWVHHLRATGCRAYIVGAMDDQMLEWLLDQRIPAFAMSSGLTLSDFGWGSPTFHKMGREKINLIHTFTQFGFDVLISDVDTVWLRNPIPYMQKYPEADVLTSSDLLANTVDDEGLEKWPQADAAANIGIMLFRPRARELAKEWLDMLLKDDKVWDQNAFNDLFRRGSRALPDRPDRLFSGYDGKLKLGILPVALFASGHTGFTQRMPEKLGLRPYVVHATFQFGGTPGKRHRMRERLWWKDEPDTERAHFNHPGGYIVHAHDVPQALLDAVRAGERDGSLNATLPHFNLVNHQLLQLRALFALAGLSGRAAILPQLWCGMDRWWAPHYGTIPGSNLVTPYPCPADHMLDLEHMSRPLEEREFGPNFEYRESSFLNNTQAQHLKQSTVVVEVCADGAADAACCDGSAPPAVIDGVARLRPGLHEAQVAAALAALKQYKVVEVRGGVARLWGGHSEAEAAKRFKRRLDVYGSIWCCVNAHPGHVWYDFFFDQVPHTDRHNRAVAGPWFPLTGP